MPCFFLRASALVVIAAGLSSCSVLLDWDGYSGEIPDASTRVPVVPEATVEVGAEVTTGAPEASPEAATPPEAGREAGQDATAEAATAPPCAPSTCNGCCVGNDCRGGQSADSCGAGAQACMDCQSSGMACISGRCAAAPEDAEAGTPTCTVATCSAKLCIPAWQAICCKSDGTCGCETLYPPGPCL